MAGRAVYTKLAGKFGAAAAKSYLYGGDDKAITDAFLSGAGGDSKFVIDRQAKNAQIASDKARNLPRVSKDSFYKNDNGLSVKFYKAGGMSYFDVIHTASNQRVNSDNLIGIVSRGNKDTLSVLESVSKRVNFKMPAKAIQRAIAADPERVKSALKTELSGRLARVNSRSNY